MTVADWRAEWRLQRKQHNPKAPQEQGFSDEEIEDVSAESVRERLNFNFPHCPLGTPTSGVND